MHIDACGSYRHKRETVDLSHSPMAVDSTLCMLMSVLHQQMKIDWKMSLLDLKMQSRLKCQITCLPRTWQWSVDALLIDHQLGNHEVDLSR